MPLAPGTRFGPYEVTAQIGAGGMGEVYRATDTSLGRDVAIKVLPAAFAQDADRLARFEREAKTLAAVNHTNIAAIYGLEKSQGTCALVMELVEGLTLAERIAQGSIPVDETLPIGRQIAEALEVAHEKGIIHRDLKPANIKVRSDGTVKVLDFGLAKAMDPAPGSPSGSHSPTITTPAMTQAGMILGTAAYMSPEQARGGQVDKRADVWAFGVVLYEMLAGRRLFDEGTVSDTLAAVLKSEVKLDALPTATPSAVKRLIARCLTRDWRRRLRDIGEARIAIEDALAHPEDVTLDTGASRQTASQPVWRSALPWAIAAGALVVAGAAAWAPWRSEPAREQVTRLSTDFGADLTLNSDFGSNVVLSPDGRLLALTGSSRPGDRTRLHVRRLDQLQASPLPGTDGARNPFFAPDGQWIGFFADGKLKKIPISGGTAVTLCDAPDDRGGSWSEDGWIVFSPRSGEAPLFRVSSDGGAPNPLTQLGAGEVTHRWPQVLSGGRAVLYTVSKATGNYEEATIAVRSLGSGQTQTVHQGGYYAKYLPTGHLMYMSQGTLFAAPFDLDRLEIASQASPMLADVTSSPRTGGAQFTFAPNGSFAYVPRSSDAARPSIFWMSEGGKTQPLRPVAAAYVEIRLSPDGERIAATIRNQQSDLWVYEWGRDILSRSTTHPSADSSPVWTPDGRRITFRSSRSGVDNIYWQRADGTGEPQRLTESKLPQVPTSWHPSGKFLAFREIGQETGQDIWILPMDGDDVSGWKPGKPTVVLAGSSDEIAAAFSPDGRWLAYESNESGGNEVYVVPFPGPGRRWQVSTSGGSLPRWSGAGSELFYLGGDQRIMVAAYPTPGDSFRAAPPRVWAESTVTDFDLHRDGKRVAVLKAPDSQSPGRSGGLVFIFDFFEELRRVTTQ